VGKKTGRAITLLRDQSGGPFQLPMIDLVEAASFTALETNVKISVIVHIKFSHTKRSIEEANVIVPWSEVKRRKHQNPQQ
jgi:hypothetical protein